MKFVVDKGWTKAFYKKAENDTVYSITLVKEGNMPKVRDCVYYDRRPIDITEDRWEGKGFYRRDPVSWEWRCLFPCSDMYSMLRKKLGYSVTVEQWEYDYESTVL